MKTRAVLMTLIVAAGSACDDQIKYVPIFSTMAEQASVEAFEAPPRTAVPGTMPVDGQRSLALLEADTALANPLRGTAEEIEWGRELFGQFCTPCHGTAGDGTGPVVGPNRFPFIITMDLHADRAKQLSDGYIYGMITAGRGLMPSYSRIPAERRWYIVSYVRELQRQGPPEGSGGPP